MCVKDKRVLSNDTACVRVHAIFKTNKDRKNSFLVGG